MWIESTPVDDHERDDHEHSEVVWMDIITLSTLYHYPIILQDAPGIEYLINSYPEYRLVKSIPIEGDDNKVFSITVNIIN